MPEPLKLFISYRSSDAPKVDKIARDLALLKHEDGTPRYAPWQDKHLHIRETNEREIAHLEARTTQTEEIAIELAMCVEAVQRLS